jgi:hypothetical protein
MEGRGFPVHTDDLLPSATEHLIERLNVKGREEFDRLFAKEPDTVKNALREDLNRLARNIYAYARASR